MKCIVIETSPERINAKPVTNEDGSAHVYATISEARAELNANGYSYNRENQRYYIKGTEYRAYIIREDSEEYADAITTEAHNRAAAALIDAYAEAIGDAVTADDPEAIDAFSVAVKLALGTGARVGEICGLKFSDVTNDETDGYILTIRRAIGRAGGKLIEKDTKSHKIRRVPLTDDLVSAIEARRLLMQRQTNKFNVGDYYITGYPDGKPLSPNYCSKMWATFAKTFAVKGKDREGNVRPLGFHGLRHSFASDYIRRNGYSDGAYDRLSQVLGHSSITITRGTYVNPSMQNTRRDMESGVPVAGTSTLKEADIIAFAPTGTDD